MTTPFKEYKGFAIEVQQSGNFYTRIGEDLVSRPALAELERDIDAYLRLQAKLKKLSLPVVDREGKESYVLTGIHLGTSAATTQPSVPGHHRPNHYLFDSPEVRKLAWVKQVVDRLFESVKVKASYGYGRMDPGRYDGCLEELSKSYEKAQSAAAGLVGHNLLAQDLDQSE